MLERFKDSVEPNSDSGSEVEALKDGDERETFEYDPWRRNIAKNSDEREERETVRSVGNEMNPDNQERDDYHRGRTTILYIGNDWAPYLETNEITEANNPEEMERKESDIDVRSLKTTMSYRLLRRRSPSPTFHYKSSEADNGSGHRGDKNNAEVDFSEAFKHYRRNKNYIRTPITFEYYEPYEGDDGIQDIEGVEKSHEMNNNDSNVRLTFEWHDPFRGQQRYSGHRGFRDQPRRQREEWRRSKQRQQPQYRQSTAQRRYPRDRGYQK